jgi:autotransporter-associated beta strand protein
VNDGVLRVSAASALGATTKTVRVVGNASANPALTPELQLTGNIAITVGQLFTSGTGMELGSGVLRNLSGDNRITATTGITLTSGNGPSTWQSDAGSLTLNGPVAPDTTQRSLFLTGAGNGVVNGPIADGAGNNRLAGLIKDGPGTWKLAGTCTYRTNTSILAGTLGLTGTGSISLSSNILVSAGALLDLTEHIGPPVALGPGQTLQGNGSVTGQLLVGPNACIAPGTPTTAGLLTLDFLGVQSGGTLHLNLAGPGAGTGHDQIAATSVVFDPGAGLDWVPTFVPATGTVFTVVNNSGVDPVSGVLSWQGTSLPEGATFTAGGVSFEIRYTGGDGNDVTLTTRNSGFAAWVSTFAALPADQRGPGDDHDGDGMVNLLEYFSALDPASASLPMTTALDASETTLRFLFRRNRFIADLEYVYEWSNDLVAWNPADAEHVFTEQIVGGDTQHDMVRTTLTCPASTGLLYARLKVQFRP